ncbi:hypothetical protein PoB_001854300 [Plakobranchus ocellatus]|uniref:Uncharacterized protein n=1 Tax=Plakobranchus ocellatus TaxID=259542 RepID=A0AAV3ZBQ9_9GAST|nr:hypothetical protein PoB_001854300 [Plakobranchus ocellatus]
MTSKDENGRNGGQTVLKEDQISISSSGSSASAYGVWMLATDDGPTKPEGYVNKLNASSPKGGGTNKIRGVEEIDLAQIHPRYRRKNKGFFPFKDKKIKKIATSTDRYNRRRSCEADYCSPHESKGVKPGPGRRWFMSFYPVAPQHAHRSPARNRARQQIMKNAEDVDRVW